MEARLIEVRIRLVGPGVDTVTCEGKLGVKGNYVWSRPNLPAQHAWGLSHTIRTVLLPEAVEPILVRVHAVREQWIELLDEHPDWAAGMVCTVTMQEREPRHGDYPCLMFESDQIRRMAELRLELDVAFR